MIEAGQSYIYICPCCKWKAVYEHKNGYGKCDHCGTKYPAKAIKYLETR